MVKKNKNKVKEVKEVNKVEKTVQDTEKVKEVNEVKKITLTKQEEKQMNKIMNFFGYDLKTALNYNYYNISARIVKPTFKIDELIEVFKNE